MHKVKSTVLLDAHMDEVGLVAVENVGGFVKAAAIGSPDIRTLPCGEIRFIDGTYGVVSFLPPHLKSGGDGIVPLEELFIDTGGVEVPVGTPGVFISSTAESGALLSSKSLDNRASCAVLLDVLRRLDGETLDVDVAALFSTQEEVGLRGAKPGAAYVGAEYAIVVDVTFGRSADTTGYQAFPPGKGPTIGIGPNMNRRFTERVRAVADAHGIAYQTEVLPGSSGTNASVIQLSNSGCATALISVPLKYMHTASETLNPRDLQSASDLIYFVLKEWEQL
ncbi:MAG: M20/M25/M40 family metallo-hydrolase [Oscillospiraceae bacterium]|jgi:endoglucanase|nr:M20/M25/M40 family metallo-hydrolase [Oscillospiraceae bacterium]